MKDFLSKCDQIRRNLRILSYLPKKSLMKNFIFCAVQLIQKTNHSLPMFPFISMFSNILHLLLPEMFYKKGVFKGFAKFTGKQMCLSLLFDKPADHRPGTFLKKRLWHRRILVNFVKFLRRLCFGKTPPVAASDFQYTEQQRKWVKHPYFSLSLLSLHDFF